MFSRFVALCCAPAVVVFSGCTGVDDELEPAFDSPRYRDTASWLCHPDKPDSVCATDLDTTLVFADGSTELRPHTEAESPEIDCFYVYPTVSMDETANADFEPGDEEIFTTRMQFARYSSVCRPFAPVYRQVTLGSMFAQQDISAELFEVGYADVAEAWQHYLAQYNDGRPVLLVGHSQGSRVLSDLLARVIEPDAELHDRIVGAHLIGMSIAVPEGERVGADLASTPICSDPDEWGCVTTFLSFEADTPPQANVFVGQPAPGTEVPCTHPNGSGALNPVFPSSVPGIVGGFLAGTTTPWPEGSSEAAIETPFFALPDLVTAECEIEGRFGFLGITLATSEADPRTRDLGGDFLDGWGLHLIDMNLAQDDLVALAAQQAALAP